MNMPMPDDPQPLQTRDDARPLAVSVLRTVKLGGPTGPLRPVRPKRPVRPVAVPPFGPDDQSQPDVAGVLAEVQALKDRCTRDLVRLQSAGARSGRSTSDPSGEKPPKPPLRRSDLLLPFLVIRSFAGDVGARPTATDTTHSPDIVLTRFDYSGGGPSVMTRDDAAALADQPIAVLQDQLYTVWVHVWNLGRAPAVGVRVRAWAPTGPRSGLVKTYLGGAVVDLGDRTSAASHLLVRVGTWAGPVSDAYQQDLTFEATAECIVDSATGGGAPSSDRHRASRLVTVHGYNH